MIYWLPFLFTFRKPQQEQHTSCYKLLHITLVAYVWVRWPKYLQSVGAYYVRSWDCKSLIFAVFEFDNWRKSVTSKSNIIYYTYILP